MRGLDEIPQNSFMLIFKNYISLKTSGTNGG